MTHDWWVGFLCGVVVSAGFWLALIWLSLSLWDRR